MYRDSFILRLQCSGSFFSSELITIIYLIYSTSDWPVTITIPIYSQSVELNSPFPGYSIKQVACFLVKAIMRFQASRSLSVHLSLVLNLTILIVHSTYFSMLRFLSIIPVVMRCSSFSLLIKKPKKDCVAFTYCIYKWYCVGFSLYS